jgi:hypothetical protein
VCRDSTSDTSVPFDPSIDPRQTRAVISPADRPHVRDLFGSPLPAVRPAGSSGVHSTKQSPIDGIWYPKTANERREARLIDMVCRQHELERQFGIPGGNTFKDIPQATKFETEFRHSFWSERRYKIIEAMGKCAIPPLRMSRIINCGSQCTLYRSDDSTRVKLGANYCHDRMCQACGRTRANLIAGNLAAAMQGKEIRFITLTLKHRPSSLKDCMDRLFTCFSRLRERDIWKKNVRGGAVFFEVTLNAETHRWHTHLHMLVEGRFIAKNDLSNAWLAVTGDSCIVDIAAVPDAERRARYCAKYASKPLHESIVGNPDKLQEFIVTIKGRRLCTTVGSWRGIKLEAHGDETDTGWVAIGRWGDVVRKAKEGDAESVRWYDAVTREVNRQRSKDEKNDSETGNSS